MLTDCISNRNDYASIQNKYGILKMFPLIIELKCNDLPSVVVVVDSVVPAEKFTLIH